MWRQDASNWLAEALAHFVKEWRCELRTRYALNTLALFAVTTLVVVSASLGPVGGAPMMRDVVLPALFWVILLFAASSGLPRAFVHEQEARTATALRLAARPSALFCGKALYAVTLLLCVEALVTPLFLAMTQLSPASPGRLALALLAGGFGLAVGSTLIAALISQAQGRATLFAVLAFPVLLPAVLMAVAATRVAVSGEPAGDGLRMLLVYDGTLTVAALMLFPIAWNP
jgi:heme exporter protein B